MVGNGDALGNWNPWEGSVELSTTEKDFDVVVFVLWQMCIFSYIFNLNISRMFSLSAVMQCRTIPSGSQEQLSSQQAQSTNMCLGSRHIKVLLGIKGAVWLSKGVCTHPEYQQILSTSLHLSTFFYISLSLWLTDSPYSQILQLL